MDYNTLARKAYSTFVANQGNTEQALNSINFDQLTPKQTTAWEAVARTIVEEVPNVRTAASGSIR